MKRNNPPQCIIDFSQPSDFEKVFRPTKWSIRLYLNHLKTLDLRIHSIFVEHTIHVLSHNYKDKDTRRFVESIRHKARALHKPGGNFHISDVVSHKLRTVGGREEQNRIISSIAELKIQGLILCTWEELADFIKKSFELRYAKSTILSKLYELNNSSRNNLF